MKSDLHTDAMVLLVDGDDTVLESLGGTLRQQGFTVVGASTGPVALQQARTLRPDVIISEVALAGMDGFEVLRRLRADRITMPVLFLSARSAVADKLRGFTEGGEDYLTKPCHPEEVAARLRVILRRCRLVDKAVGSTWLTFDDLDLDGQTHHVWKNGQPIALSPTEFALLHYFMSHPGRVLCKPVIMRDVWPSRVGGDLNVVEMYVSYLRRKIDTGPTRLLHTLPGVGYVLRTS